MRFKNNNMDLTKLREVLGNLSKEETEKYFPKDTKPKGWLNIKQHLPKMKAMDIVIGATEYKVRYSDGTEGTTMVSDHNTWYYYAKEVGITHWFNK